jgi:preprotein translocase subunit SecA
MLSYLVKKTFGTRNDRILKSVKPIVAQVNALEPKYRALSDIELEGQTPILRERLSQGAALDDLLPDTFALVREVSRRVLEMRHFDVQLIGGYVLHKGMIAEMKTGEGKTLVATLPAVLNALSGKGVHVVTVNDYLARRDAEWMGRIYRFLGLSVGVIVPQLELNKRREAYAADITYGQNNEFGFDFLRDNMKYSLEEMSQRPHNFAIVDEVDSILIDEARTPLIISGPAEESTDKYDLINRIIPALIKERDFVIDLKSKTPTLTEDGISHVEKLLKVSNLYDPQNIELVHHVNQGLKAHYTMQLDVDYVVRDGQIVIVDEFTGRLMPGRRWSDGLHQAVEAKEGQKVARENQTLASITFQNYFRMYTKLSGMTGTADTEAVEFKKIYNLEVVVIPTNKPMVREDRTDLVLKTRDEKYDLVIEHITECFEKHQPVLVGTISIEQSEHLARLLKSKGIPHNVLNAKHHEREAEIVAQAGRLGMVTIATNMAGRGTDILLGGNPEFLAAAEAGTKDKDDPKFQEALAKYRTICGEERTQVLAAGGLHIIGTERHESRRIDNQLRGRAGRQGDPGSSEFFVALEDDLMRRFAGERVQRIMDFLKVDKGTTLQGRMISGSIETAQRRVEGHHFDIRKHLLDFDDVMNKQRQVVYSERNGILADQEVRGRIQAMADDLIEESILSLCPESVKPTEWDLKALTERISFLFNKKFELVDEVQLTHQVLFDMVRKHFNEIYSKQIEAIGDEQFHELEQHISLESLDQFWKNHLLDMDHLRDGIGLRGYGQKNPLHEYQREGFILFQRMLTARDEDVVRKLCSVRPLTQEEIQALEEAEMRRRQQREKQMALVHNTVTPDGKELTAEEIAAAKSPETEREKLKAAKKMRRKFR